MQDWCNWQHATLPKSNYEFKFRILLHQRNGVAVIKRTVHIILGTSLPNAQNECVLGASPDLKRQTERAKVLTMVLE